ncbi:MAG: hypothetical protein V3U98_08725 [Acidobacteriota bacterium]
MVRFSRTVLVLTCLLCAVPGAVRAEDERGRWSFGFGLSVQSTLDDIRSNAGVFFSEELRGGDPDGDFSNDRVTLFDRRQDDLLGRSTKIEEKQRLEFSAAYGLTSWLSLQLDVGLYEADVAPLDVFTLKERWSQVVGETVSLFEQVTEEISEPFTVGSLRQIPISLNAVVRFRKDSPFNPFLGVGVGYMFNDIETGGSFEDLNRRILRGFNRVMLELVGGDETLLNTQEITQGFINVEIQNSSAGLTPEFLYKVDCTQIGTGQTGIVNTCTENDNDPRRLAALPTQPFIKTAGGDSFFWQVSVGADYHFHARGAAYVAARYLVTDAQVSVTITGPKSKIVGDQLVTDGTFETSEASFRFLSEENPREPNGLDNRFKRTQSDNPQQNPGDPEFEREFALQETILVQGGEIDLTAFVVGAGLRFKF